VSGLLRARIRTAGWLIFLLLCAARADAASTVFTYTGGAATVTASVDGTPIGVATLNLNGAFASFDSSTGMLTDFNFTTAPNQWIVLNTVYGGYNQVWVNSASVVPDTGYHTLSSTPISPGHWNTSVMPVLVNAVYTAKNSNTQASVGPLPLSYQNSTPLSAVIDVVAGTFTLQGLTLGIVPVPGESAPVVVGATLTFTGVPEPGSLGLAALAGLGIALARRRSGS